MPDAKEGLGTYTLLNSLAFLRINIDTPREQQVGLVPSSILHAHFCWTYGAQQRTAHILSIYVSCQTGRRQCIQELRKRIMNIINSICMSWFFQRIESD